VMVKITCLLVKYGKLIFHSQIDIVKELKHIQIFLD